MSTRVDAPPPETPVVAQLSRLDRFLPVLIALAMGAGLLLGRLIDGLNDALDTVKVGQTSLPIALGLLLMMYPVLAKVRYDEVRIVTADRRMMVASLILNWLVGPMVTFALAWLLLPDQPAYRTGVILVGLVAYPWEHWIKPRFEKRPRGPDGLAADRAVVSAS